MPHHIDSHNSFCHPANRQPCPDTSHNHFRQVPDTWTSRISDYPNPSDNGCTLPRTN